MYALWRHNKLKNTKSAEYVVLLAGKQNIGLGTDCQKPKG